MTTLLDTRNTDVADLLAAIRGISERLDDIDRKLDRISMARLDSIHADVPDAPDAPVVSIIKRKPRGRDGGQPA